MHAGERRRIIEDKINHFITKDNIDLPTIVHYKSVTKAVPGYLNEFPPPVVGYKYTRTISSNILIRRV